MFETSIDTDAPDVGGVAAQHDARAVAHRVAHGRDAVDRNAVVVRCARDETRITNERPASIRTLAIKARTSERSAASSATHAAQHSTACWRTYNRNTLKQANARRNERRQALLTVGRVAEHERVARAARGLRRGHRVACSPGHDTTHRQDSEDRQ